MVESDLRGIASTLQDSVQDLQTISNESVLELDLDVIVADLSDLNSRGLRLIKHLREKQSPTVFVFCDREATSEAVREAYESDALEVLFRPTAAELETSIMVAKGCCLCALLSSVLEGIWRIKQTASRLSTRYLD